MAVKKNIIDRYYKYIQEELHCEISEELLGKKYIIDKAFGTGNFSRMKIEEGLEISKCSIYTKDMCFDNTGYNEEILEIGYCYSGNMEISILPGNKKYTIKEGQVFIYKTLTAIKCFKLKYNNCKTLSINMHFDSIKNAINPIWEHKLIADWELHMDNIFKEDLLIIEEASYNLKKIAEELDSISIKNMLDYMKLKLKTIEFLATVFQEKSSIKVFNHLNKKQSDIVIQAKGIINNNLQNPPELKSLAQTLKISLYKLQKAFKELTGSTVYEYIKRTRIERAKYLLNATSESILEIANEVGYQNPSKFSYVFKQYNGVNPLEYRKTNK